MSLLLLEGVLLDGLVVVNAVSSSGKIVKMHGFLLRGDCEAVVDLSISRAGGKSNHKENEPNFVEGFGEKGGIW